MAVHAVLREVGDLHIVGDLFWMAPGNGRRLRPCWECEVPRRALNKFKAVVPTDDDVQRYYRLYDGDVLHHRPDELPAISSADLFHNDLPLVLDLGCGRGEFLVGQAAENRDVNYVGIDFHRKALWDAVSRASSARLDNALFIKSDLRLVTKKVPEASIREIHILFPGPVVVRKHRRKDVMSPRFIDALCRALEPGGRLHFVTDHRQFFFMKLALLDERLCRTKLTEGLQGGLTWYQRVWERHGLPSLRAEYVKGGGATSCSNAVAHVPS